MSRRAVASDEAGTDLVARLCGRARRSAGSTRACGGARKRAFSVSASIPPPAAGPAARDEGDDDDARQACTAARRADRPGQQERAAASTCRRAGSPKPRMATLQHALARGLEVVFQLEEGEILTEPVPSRDSRRAILLSRQPKAAPACSVAWRASRGRWRRWRVRRWS